MWPHRLAWRTIPNPTKVTFFNTCGCGLSNAAAMQPCSTCDVIGHAVRNTCLLACLPAYRTSCSAAPVARSLDTSRAQGLPRVLNDRALLNNGHAAGSRLACVKVGFRQAPTGTRVFQRGCGSNKATAHTCCFGRVRPKGSDAPALAHPSSSAARRHRIHINDSRCAGPGGQNRNACGTRHN